MSSKLRDMAERLQQAPNVSEQMAKLDQMMTVGYDDYWKGRQRKARLPTFVASSRCHSNRFRLNPCLT